MKIITIFKFIAVFIIALTIGTILNDFIIPMTTSLVDTLLALVKLVQVLEMPYKFFGLATILFIAVKIFSALIYIVELLFKLAIKLSKKEEEESKKKEGEKN